MKKKKHHHVPYLTPPLMSTLLAEITWLGPGEPSDVLCDTLSLLVYQIWYVASIEKSKRIQPRSWKLTQDMRFQTASCFLFLEHDSRCRCLPWQGIHECLALHEIEPEMIKFKTYQNSYSAHYEDFALWRTGEHYSNLFRSDLVEAFRQFQYLDSHVMAFVELARNRLELHDCLQRFE